ncbi:hypothetical protein BG011_003899 [Mortierella polycephala]|uniref:RNI-like protein n=1 Tax=Mortierella polycephala TaxID=41804 RepID=A0A9P6Q301_9FUNG|nr:hypothetical protein BG011_003899 [Mortierella polycephala]
MPLPMANSPATNRSSSSNSSSSSSKGHRTGSAKSVTGDLTGVEDGHDVHPTAIPNTVAHRSMADGSTPMFGRSRTASGSVTTLMPLAPVISAIKHGYFLKLTDLSLEVLVRTLEGKNSTVLETINIGSTAILGTDAKLLSKLIKSSDAANIKVLKLDRNAVSQQAFKYLSEALKQNRTITTFSISRAGVSDKTIKYIAKALTKNETLKVLDLSSNRITAEGAGVLCEALYYNRSLTRLCLQSNNIKAIGAPYLAELLSKNRVLRHLNIGSNGLGAEGCTLIAESVRFNRCLYSLSLDMNDMGPKGAEAIAAALVSNRHLAYLYIPHNTIGDEGLVDICESLKRNKTIVGLDLEFNHIGQEQSEVGMRALGQVLKTNTVLREINLSFNIFTGSAIHALMEGVSVNTTLESILLTSCCISTEGAMTIAHVLPKAVGLQNLGLTANPDIAVEGYWALSMNLARNRSMKGIQLDYNSEDRHVLYEQIQHSLTRNFIWQRAVYSAACRILAIARIVVLGRPVHQRMLQCREIEQQKQQQDGNGGAWSLLRKVGFGRTTSSTSLALQTSQLTPGKSSWTGSENGVGSSGPVSHVHSEQYNAHKVMANIGNMPYEIFEAICAFLDPGRTMSIIQIRAAVQAAGDRSTLMPYYTRKMMLEKIFCQRYIPPVGMRYNVKNEDERP